MVETKRQCTTEHARMVSEVMLMRIGGGEGMAIGLICEMHARDAKASALVYVFIDGGHWQRMWRRFCVSGCCSLSDQDRSAPFALLFACLTTITPGRQCCSRPAEPVAADDTFETVIVEPALAAATAAAAAVATDDAVEAGAAEAIFRLPSVAEVTVITCRVTVAAGAAVLALLLLPSAGRNCRKSVISRCSEIDSEETAVAAEEVDGEAEAAARLNPLAMSAVLVVGPLLTIITLLTLALEAVAGRELVVAFVADVAAVVSGATISPKRWSPSRCRIASTMASRFWRGLLTNMLPAAPTVLAAAAAAAAAAARATCLALVAGAL